MEETIIRQEAWGIWYIGIIHWIIVQRDLESIPGQMFVRTVLAKLKFREFGIHVILWVRSDDYYCCDHHGIGRNSPSSEIYYTLIPEWQKPRNTGGELRELCLVDW
jgi:hypothetical protein